MDYSIFTVGLASAWALDDTLSRPLSVLSLTFPLKLSGVSCTPNLLLNSQKAFLGKDLVKMSGVCLEAGICLVSIRPRATCSCM